jgi:hypothetical protein
MVGRTGPLSREWPHRVISVPRNYWVAFGVKPTSTEGKVTKPD